MIHRGAPLLKISTPEDSGKRSRFSIDFTIKTLHLQEPYVGRVKAVVVVVVVVSRGRCNQSCPWVLEKKTFSIITSNSFYTKHH